MVYARVSLFLSFYACTLDALSPLHPVHPTIGSGVEVFRAIHLHRWHERRGRVKSEVVGRWVVLWIFWCGGSPIDVGFYCGGSGCSWLVGFYCGGFGCSWLVGFCRTSSSYHFHQPERLCPPVMWVFVMVGIEMWVMGGGCDLWLYRWVVVVHEFFCYGYMVVAMAWTRIRVAIPD